MAAKQLEVGDPVLWYGMKLNITGLDEVEGVQRAVCEDVAGQTRRAEAREQVLALRAEQEATDVAVREYVAATRGSEKLPDDDPRLPDMLRAAQASEVRHAELALQIRALNKQAEEAFARVKLRQDLLSWWEQKGVWVQEGKILTDAQHARFIKAMGLGKKNVPAEGQRNALLYLESQGG